LHRIVDSVTPEKQFLKTIRNPVVNYPSKTLYILKAVLYCRFERSDFDESQKSYGIITGGYVDYARRFGGRKSEKLSTKGSKCTRNPAMDKH